MAEKLVSALLGGDKLIEMMIPKEHIGSDGTYIGPPPEPKPPLGPMPVYIEVAKIEARLVDILTESRRPYHEVQEAIRGVSRLAALAMQAETKEGA